MAMMNGLVRGFAVVVVGAFCTACTEDEKTLTLPHGDTLTVPESYEFKQRVAYDSLNGTLQDGDGRTIFSYDACGIATGLDIAAMTGETQSRSVNADFVYGHFPESWPGLWVAFPGRGPSVFVFDGSVGDDEALALIKTLTAQPRASSTSCQFADP
jgi:hypothetical protein